MFPKRHPRLSRRSEVGVSTETEGFKRCEQAAQTREAILRLAQGQRDMLAASFADLLGDGEPTDETAEDMIQAIREWRDTRSNNRSRPGKLVFDKRNEYLWQLP